MLEVFSDNWNQPPTLNDGERLLRLINHRNRELYVIVDDSMEDIDEEITWALRRKCGRQAIYEGYEDVSFICKG